MSTPSPYITAKQAAQQVGLSHTCMRQLLNEGRIRGAIKPQRDWLGTSHVEILPRESKEQ